MSEPTVSIVHPHLYLNEFDLTGEQPSQEGDIEYDEIDSKGGAATAHTNVLGLEKGTISHDAFLAGGVGKTDDILAALESAAIVASFHSLTPADGGRMFFYSGELFTFRRSGQVGDAWKVNFSGMAKDAPGFVHGTILAPKASRTVDGNGTARQLGSAENKTVYAIVHCFAASGSTPTLDLIVESDDNSGMTSPITRATFSQLTGVGSEFISAAIGAGITDDWWRVSWDLEGTTPDFTFAAIVGIK